MEVTNNNPGEDEVQVKAYAVEVLSGKNYKCSPESLTVKVNKSTTVGCKLTGLPDGNYRGRADFQRDFDEYARTQSFFGAPTEYKNPVDGLYKYFRDPERFTFKPRFGQQNPEGYMLPGPGIYDVTLNITYDDARWKLFDGNKLTARIEVLLDRLDSPEPDSPFYHLPFDGPIGD